MCLQHALSPSRLTSERSDRPARSSRGVARKRNGINHVSGMPAVANPSTPVIGWHMFMIVIDPHEGSLTGVAVESNETVIDMLRVEADAHQRARLLAWAARFE